jgi:hypothetical protein
MGTNVSTNFITAPADPKETLGIKLPFLVMIIKNVHFFEKRVKKKSFIKSKKYKKILYIRIISTG